MNIQQAFSKIQSSSQKNKFPQMRHIEDLKIGQWIRQGDIYFLRVDSFETISPYQGFQLAPGNSKGSRHILNDNPKVKLFVIDNTTSHFDFQCGPGIEAKDRFTVSHPEHGHYNLPAGNYRVFYQLDWVRKQRVMD